MSVFTPSAEFNARWLGSPSVIKNAIYKELSDIIELLQEDTSADFEFTHANLDEILTPLQTQHLAQQKAQLYAQKQQEAAVLLPQLESQVDSLVAEKKEALHQELTVFADNLKAWLKKTIEDEVKKYEP